MYYVFFYTEKLFKTNAYAFDKCHCCLSFALAQRSLDEFGDIAYDRLIEGSCRRHHKITFYKRNICGCRVIHTHIQRQLLKYMAYAGCVVNALALYKHLFIWWICCGSIPIYYSHYPCPFTNYFNKSHSARAPSYLYKNIFRCSLLTAVTIMLSYYVWVCVSV